MRKRLFPTQLKTAPAGKLLQQCKLLVWGECTISHKRSIKALTRAMQDINKNQSIMGGMVVLLAGDFRQILPVITKGTPADEINAYLKSSTLWQLVEKLSLTANMRVQLHSNTRVGQFASALIKIGEDKVHKDSNGMITLEIEFCNVVQSADELINQVYPELQNNVRYKVWLRERAILEPTNKTVDQISKKLMSQIDAKIVEYILVDNVMDTEQVTTYLIEFLKSLELSGVPSRKLRLKVGVQVLLMGNLDAPRMSNVTRLQITELGHNIIKAEILSGIVRGDNVVISCIPIIRPDLPFHFKRLEFPVKAPFGKTINKAQGQRFKVAGIHLEKQKNFLSRTALCSLLSRIHHRR